MPALEEKASRIPIDASSPNHPLSEIFPHIRTPAPELPQPAPGFENRLQTFEAGGPVFLGALGGYESLMALTREEGDNPVTRFYAADRIGLRPKYGYKVEALLSDLSRQGFDARRPYKEARLVSLHLSEEQSHRIASLRKVLRKHFAGRAAVDYFEVFKPSFSRFDSAPVIPNDPLYRKQWNLDAIEAPKAWRFHRGSSDIVVGVIDSGIYVDHQDFAGRLVEGKNFAYVEGAGVPEGMVDQRSGHGTAMSSAIAAVPNNNYLVSAITWYCKVMPLKWRHETFAPYGSNVAAIDFALKHNIRILNKSSGGGPNDLLTEALREAARADCLFVAAMGNFGDENPHWPAAVDEAVAVGASDKNRRRVYYSNFGDHIDLIAPGEQVPALSPDPDENYWVYSGGTSLAAAQVSASAAILLSINPEFTRRDLKLYLYAGTDDELGDETDTPGWDKYHGWGHLNLYNSVVLAMMPTKIHEASGERGTLRWKVPTRRRAEVGYQIEVSYDLETWYPIQNPEIRFEGEDAFWDFHNGDSPAGTKQKSFYRVRPTFSQDLLEAASL